MCFIYIYIYIHTYIHTQSIGKGISVHDTYQEVRSKDAPPKFVNEFQLGHRRLFKLLDPDLGVNLSKTQTLQVIQHFDCKFTLGTKEENVLNRALQIPHN
jgi:hypothetical protein